MKSFKFSILFFTVVIAMAGCKKFEDLEKDPNRSTSVPASLVLRGILADMYESPWSQEQRWNQFWCINYNYYGTNEYWLGSATLNYSTLENVVKMEDEAKKQGLAAKNQYSALGKFFRAYFFSQMSLKVGDIPMTEALQGAANAAPKYDKQADVFKQCIAWLDEANSDLSDLIAQGNITASGDFFFNGDLAKWQKTVNALKLRLLIHLSKKVDTAGFSVKDKFAEVISNPSRFPLPAGNDDNMVYLFTTLSKYPLNPSNFGFYALRYNMSATYLNTLSSLHDPRTFLVAEPAAAKIAGGLTAADFDAYVGANSGEDLGGMSTEVQAGLYSLIRKDRYYASDEGEPCIQFGYPEVCFAIAEAANRGWITADAKTWYENGITASLAFYGIAPAAITAYIAQPAIAYKSGTDGLTQILTQKYLAYFQNSGLEAYYQWRRTGVPTFLTGPGTANSSRVPLRFQYPTSERDNNSTNYKAALNSQFGAANDDINGQMWLIQ
jgi:hypothetical protein